jgi:hypothetical protein
MKTPDIMKMIGGLWNELSDTKKKPFVTKAEQDVKRYEKELKHLEKNGYFINENGENSRDLKVKPKKSKVVETDVMPTKTRTAYIYFVTSIHS